jgi:hypothetical protein
MERNAHALKQRANDDLLRGREVAVLMVNRIQTIEVWLDPIPVQADLPAEEKTPDLLIDMPGEVAPQTKVLGEHLDARRSRTDDSTVEGDGKGKGKGKKGKGDASEISEGL